MSNVDVELLYGVSGGGDLNGASGREISRSLKRLVSNLNKAKIPTVKIYFDDSDLKNKLKDLKNRITKALGESGKINISAIGGNAKSSKEQSNLSAYMKKQLSTQTALSKEIDKAYKAQEQFYKSHDTRTEKYQTDQKAQASAVKGLTEQIKTAELAQKRKKELNDQATSKAINSEAVLQREYNKTRGQYRKLVENTSMYIQRMEKQGLSTAEARKQLALLRKEMQAEVPKTGDLETDLDNLKRKYDKLFDTRFETSELISKSGAADPTTWSKFISAIKNKFQSMVSGMLIASAGRALMKVYNYVVDLDTAVTNLQIATGKSREETKKLITTYAELGKQLGATVTEVAEAADTWLRQGYSVAKTNELITNTMMLAKLGQLDSAEAAKALTSAMKGYKKEVSETMGIVDKFTAVDMEAAIGAGDIATAMAETAASADVAGVSMDTLIGYIATVGEITQDSAESVGTFFKTMFARMGNVKAGVFTDDATGESLNDVEKVLRSVGISLRDDAGLFRDFGAVLDEVGAKWDSYDNVQQHAIATAFAGTRQQEKFIVLMENYGSALEYAAVSAESAGTAQEKYQKAYLDSIEAKLDTLTASWQQLSADLLDSEIVKMFVEALTGIVNLLDRAVAATDGLLVIVPAIIVSLIALHAVLVKIKTTQTWSLMMTGFVQLWNIVKGLWLSMVALVKTIYASILAHKGETAAIVAKTAATKAATAAQTAMNASNPVGWIIIAITAIIALVAALKNYKSANDKAQEASEKAIEVAEERIQAAEEEKEQTKELVDLIEEYKDAVEGIESMEQLDAVTRQKVLDIQTQITELVGEEAYNLDLINDGLDISLTKLRKLKAEQSKTDYEAALGAYAAAKDSTNKAYVEDIIDISGWFDKLQDDFYQITFERGKDQSQYASQAAQLLRELGVEVTEDSNLVDKFYGVNLNAHSAEHAVQILDKFLSEMERRGYATGSADIYNQFLRVRNKYNEILTTEKDALMGLLESTVGLKGWSMEQAGEISISSIADYDAFREQLINAVKSDSYIAETDTTLEDITEAVDNWLSLYYADWFNEKAKQYRPKYTGLKTFLDIFNEINEEYEALEEALEEMDEIGILSGDTVSELTEKYPELVEYLEEIGALVEDMDGYKLAPDSLDKYLQHIRDEYAQTVEEMQEKADTIRAAFEADPANEELAQNLADAEESLENALANQQRLEGVINSLQRSQLIEDYTSRLEAENDALDEQLDKYKDIVDIRKDLLESLQEEADYQKTLAQKTKAVADLQTKLALARLDTSASGQANVRELESELAEAEEDLSAYTLDKAISDLEDILDSEYDEYEAMINNHVAEITRAIENAAKLTTEALREAINNGSVPKYHSGGFVGGVRSNEEFAKLMEGEFVATPKQMTRFMGRTLPGMVSQSGATYNAPLIEIKCDKITQESMPQLEKVVNQAVKQIKDEINGTFDRKGIKKNGIDKFKI